MDKLYQYINIILYDIFEIEKTDLLIIKEKLLKLQNIMEIHHFVDDEILTYALIYMYRYYYHQSVLDLKKIFKSFFMAVIIANKYLTDYHLQYSELIYQFHLDITVCDLYAFELHFLKNINYNLYITQEQYDQFIDFVLDKCK